MIPNSVRTQSSSTPGSLITTLFTYIDKGKNGTLPWHLRDGMSLWRYKYSTGTAYNMNYMYSAAGTWGTATSLINKGYPVAVGLLYILSPLANKYGDHWVTAYQYKELMNKLFKGTQRSAFVGYLCVF